MTRFLLRLGCMALFTGFLHAEVASGFLPFVLNMSPDGDGVILQGSIPTKDQKEAIFSAAVEALGEEKVNNRLKLSPQTRQEPWLDELPGLIRNFLEFSPGHADFTIVDGKIILQGEVGDRKKYEILRGEISGEAPDALVFEDRITVDGVRMVPPSAEEEKEQIAEADAMPEETEKSSPSVAKAAMEKEASSEVGKLSENTPPVAERRPLKYFGPAEGRGSREVADSPGLESKKEMAKEVSIASAVPPEKAEKVVVREMKVDLAATAPPSKPTPMPSQTESSKQEPKPDSEKEKTADKVAEVEDMGPDPGGPVLFFFDTASAQLRSEDRHKINWIIERCKRPRTIVYITGYADYRGSYTLNRKLTTERNENVRRAIFAGDVAEDLKAEVKAKGEVQSDQKDSWKSQVSEEALQYRRRVVVETYHLK